jgi:hypothetical protein
LGSSNEASSNPFASYGVAGKPEYDYAFPFAEGLGGVMIGAKGGYIDLQGNIQIPLLYDRLGIFANGASLVEQNGIQFYIDNKGNCVIKEGLTCPK